MSRSAVANALGWNFRRLDGIERGRRLVRYAEIIALLEVYESAWLEFMGLEQED